MRDGQVACGHCQHSFNALDYLRTLEGPSLDKPILRSNTVLATTSKKLPALVYAGGVALGTSCLLAALYFSWLPIAVVENIQSPLKRLDLQLPPQENISHLHIVDTHFLQGENNFRADVKVENKSKVSLKAPLVRITIQDEKYNILFETSVRPQNIVNLEPATTSTMVFNLPKTPNGATYFKVQLRD